MKPIIKLIILTTIVRLLVRDVFGQGTIYFANFQDGGPNAPFYQSDGMTPLSGPQFLAELFAGPNATNLAAIATTSFLTGNAAGYFYGGIQTINTVFGGATAWVQVDVWNTASGSSFGQAQGSGLPNSWWQSVVFTVIPGRGGVNPTPAAPLIGLGTSPVFLNGVVPEPSTFALCVVGAVVVLFRLRARS
jgi:hypothetical protein